VKRRGRENLSSLYRRLGDIKRGVGHNIYRVFDFMFRISGPIYTKVHRLLEVLVPVAFR